MEVLLVNCKRCFLKVCNLRVRCLEFMLIHVLDRHYTAHTLLLNAFHASGGMTHFMQCFDQVVTFYLENYAGKSTERQKVSKDRVQPDPTSQTPLQFQLDPMEVDQSSSSSSTTTTTTTTTTSNRVFEEELAAVETTLTW